MMNQKSTLLPIPHSASLGEEMVRLLGIGQLSFDDEGRMGRHLQQEYTFIMYILQSIQISKKRSS